MKMIITYISIFVLTTSTNTATAQITTACTNSLISSFTPCLNFLTGSTNGGGSPTAGCCTALGSLISSSTDCACLILTGSVPFNLPINRQLAITLPRLCNKKKVPIQCKASATPLPSPGPVASAPSLPPLPPFGSNSEPPAAPPPTVSDLPALPPKNNEGGNQSQRPLLQLPNSAVKLSIFSLPTFLFVLVLVLRDVLLN